MLRNGAGKIRRFARSLIPLSLSWADSTSSAELRRWNLNIHDISHLSFLKIIDREDFGVAVSQFEGEYNFIISDIYFGREDALRQEENKQEIFQRNKSRQ